MIKYNPIHTLHASNRGSRATTWAWSTKAPRTTISTWSCGGLFSFMMINCLRAAPHDAERFLNPSYPNILPPIHIYDICVWGAFFMRRVQFSHKRSIPSTQRNILPTSSSFNEYNFHSFISQYFPSPTPRLKNTKTKWKKKNLHKHPLTRINTTNTT